MKDNITFKAIVYGNVARRLTGLEDDVRMWMSSPIDGFVGITVLVIGSEDIISKDIEDDTKFTPRVLLGTLECIGTGIDCDDAYLMIRLGLPTSLLHLIQEMGRCGRNKNYINTQQIHNNCYHVMFTLQEFVYLTEILYLNDITEYKTTKILITIIAILKCNAIYSTNCLSTIWTRFYFA